MLRSVGQNQVSTVESFNVLYCFTLYDLCRASYKCGWTFFRNIWGPQARRLISILASRESKSLTTCYRSSVFQSTVQNFWFRVLTGFQRVAINIGHKY